MATGEFPTVIETDRFSGGMGDPNRPTLDEALERIEDEKATNGFDGFKSKLATLANTEGDLSPFMTADALKELGQKVVDDYEQDDADRKEWKEVAEDALKACSQEEVSRAKDYPWPGASNVNFPLLTSAALQFNARMYPAVIKGDEAVLCKIVGNDNGTPKVAPNPRSGEVQPVPDMIEAPGPDGQPTLQPKMDADGQMVPLWQIPPGAKAKRARRVSDYLNHNLFYQQDSWEDDTDQLLIQIPAVGCAFRKCWYEPGVGERSATVSALNLVVPKGTRNLRTAYRITERLPETYYYDIQSKQRQEIYRDVDLGVAVDAYDKCRLVLEQHRLIDLDGDDFPEPYIVTVDHETREVLRVEANFGDGDIRFYTDPKTERDRVTQIQRRQFYVKYGMFPHPKGDFYDIGLGHLLKRLGSVIDTAINQLLDAGHAQTAGGGFIGAGVRLQTRGNRGVFRMVPGEYKTVDVSGDNLRANLVEKTLPNVSPVTFQVLDLILGAAKDIAGAKDVITGEASNTGQVGTTLALIEQGLQVFNASAKRIFRSLKDEYTLHYDNIGRYGEEDEERNYMAVLDDFEADFKADFNASDLNIAPVSDPSTVTQMQKMAKAQFLLGLAPGLAAPQVGGNPREVYKRAMEAVNVEDIDKILPPPKPTPPDPFQTAMQEAALAGAQAKAMKDTAGAKESEADALNKVLEAARKKYELERDATFEGMQVGHDVGQREASGLEATNAALGIASNGRAGT